MSSSYYRIQQAVLAVLLLLAGTASASGLEKLFAPKPDLWSRWTAHDEASRAHIDHSAWDRFLKKYAGTDRDGVTRIAYDRVSDRDLASLSDYIRALSSRSISRFTRDEQFAFWVNLYNALTVQTVLKHYPVRSIRDIDLSSGFFANGPWRKKLVEVEGEPVSLNDIEHRILRPIWKDPRVHYALNCASIGCPNLQSVAFTAKNADNLLTQGAREYVNHPRGLRISGNSMVLSSIYSWFEEDFDRDGGVPAHLGRYAKPALAAQINSFDGFQKYKYDWSLNDADVR